MLISLALLLLILGMMVVSVLGNLLVVIAVLMVKHLRQPANLLLLSLAVTDLLVSLLVMPGALYQLVTGGWSISRATCLGWIFSDVFLCSSSILTLTVICIDRYYAISRPLHYIPVRTNRLILVCILGIQLLAALVSAPALATTESGLVPVDGFNVTEVDRLPAVSEPGGQEIHASVTVAERIENVAGSESSASLQCLVSQSPAYQLYATVCSFYLPLLVMVVLYYRIYKTAKNIIQKERKSPSLGRKVSTQVSIGNIKGGKVTSSLNKFFMARDWRQTCHKDKQTCLKDKQTCHKDKQTCLKDRQTCLKDQNKSSLPVGITSSVASTNQATCNGVGNVYMNGGSAECAVNGSYSTEDRLEDRGQSNLRKPLRGESRGISREGDKSRCIPREGDKSEIITLQLNCSSADFQLLKLDSQTRNGENNEITKKRLSMGSYSSVFRSSGGRKEDTTLNSLMRQSSTQTERVRRWKPAKRSRSFPIKIRSPKSYEALLSSNQTGALKSSEVTCQLHSADHCSDCHTCLQANLKSTVSNNSSVPEQTRSFLNQISDLKSPDQSSADCSNAKTTFSPQLTTMPSLSSTKMVGSSLQENSTATFNKSYSNHNSITNGECEPLMNRPSANIYENKVDQVESRELEGHDSHESSADSCSMENQDDKTDRFIVPDIHVTRLPSDATTGSFEKLTACSNLSHSTATLCVSIPVPVDRGSKDDGLLRVSMKSASSSESNLKMIQSRSFDTLTPPPQYKMALKQSLSNPGILTDGGSGPGTKNRNIHQQRFAQTKLSSARLSRCFTGVASHARQEWKATLTVGIVLLTFLVCWLPFFALTLYTSLARNTSIPVWIHHIALWLGYTNSMLNPIIYGVLHRDFRRTFIEILSCKLCKSVSRGL